MPVSSPSIRHTISVVAIGAFNPAILSPIWFSAFNLIRKSEAADAQEKQVVSADVTVFSTDWFSVQVVQQRLVIETRDPSKSGPLRDLVKGLFGILEHTPIHAFGFNSDQAFDLPAKSTRDLWGKVAPPQLWTEVLKNPRPCRLDIDATRKDHDANRIHVILESSADECTTVIRVNQHYDVKAVEDAPRSPAFLLSKLDTDWDEFLEFTRQTADRIISLESEKGE